MTDEMEALELKVVGERNHVPGQVVERVGTDVPRASSRRVAALVGRDGPVAGRHQALAERVPTSRVLRKAVQKEGLARLRPRNAHVEGEPIVLPSDRLRHEFVSLQSSGLCLPALRERTELSVMVRSST